MPLDGIRLEMTDESPPRAEPEPGSKPRRGRPPGTGTGVRVETQIKDEMTAALKLMSMVWSTRDPVCAPVLNQQSELIAADIAKLAAKSKWAKKYLTKVAEVGTYVPLFLHIQPVLMAIHAHHIAPRMEHNTESEETINNAGYSYMG